MDAFISNRTEIGHFSTAGHFFVFFVVFTDGFLDEIDGYCYQ